MTVLVTGAAGFIGFHLCRRLIAEGYTVHGVDCLSPYYQTSLKRDRLKELAGFSHFHFIENNLADRAFMGDLAKICSHAEVVFHLAAQPGVRYSIEHPESYIDNNLVAHANVLEFCRHLKRLKHLVYASSSSIYGANEKLPFSVEDRADCPVSLYAATKRSCELMSYSYSHLFQIPATGLRFFTVYGPWGRPDMAAWKFTDAIMKGRAIQVYNHGEMRRDFTFIDDIIEGLMAVMGRPPHEAERAPHALYNLGNNNSEELMYFIHVLEQAIGKKAVVEMLPMQPGEVRDTYADIEAGTRDFGFAPKTSIAEGLPKFVEWYKAYHAL